MGVPWDGRTDIERLAKRIKALEDQVTALTAAGASVPFVDANPDVAYGNLWMFNDNKLRIRKPDGTIREVITTAAAGTTTGTGLPAAPAQPKLFQGTWVATFSQTYQQDGDQRSESFLHVGTPGGDSFNGRQTSLVGFPFATIAAALAGARISRVWLYLYATHCYWNSGSTIAIASHVNASAPGSLGGVNTGILTNVHVKGSDQGGEPDVQRWKPVSTTLGGLLRDGSSCGVALIAPSSDRSYYSILGGVGSPAPAPVIRIQYVK